MQFAYSDFEKALKPIKDMGFLNFSSIKCPLCGNTFKLFNNAFTYKIIVIQKIPFVNVKINLINILNNNF